MIDRNFIIFLAIGIGSIYYLTNMVDDLDREKEKREKAEEAVNKYVYNKFDNVGRQILDVYDLSPDEQIYQWHNSIIKPLFLEDFPNFIAMKGFVEDRVHGEYLKTRLFQKIESVEKQYFSGSLDPERAKKELGKL